jgi:hypothetical protein
MEVICVRRQEEIRKFGNTCGPGVSGREARPTMGHMGHGFHEIRLESLAESPSGVF